MEPYCKTDDGRFTLYHSDCLDALRSMPDASVDSVVTDPPAGIGFMGKAWDHDKGGRDSWIAWMQEIASECLRVLKPGGHALVWAIPRTSHWTATAWENAGFEVRDIVNHLFGSGFPKSHNVGLRIDKLNGQPDRGHRIAVANRFHPDGTLEPNGELLPKYEAKTELGKQWQGFGTALKPACEHWVLLRKPLIGTVAENVLTHGTGALNIDGCRVDSQEIIANHARGSAASISKGIYGNSKSQETHQTAGQQSGRWPANLVHDGSNCVVMEFPVVKSGVAIRGNSGGNTFGGYKSKPPMDDLGYSDSGSAARFFYCAKASASDRNDGCEELAVKSVSRMNTQNGSEDKGEAWSPVDDRTGEQRDRFVSEQRNYHPTVKATALMRYLCRLITPPNGTCLDPFVGSGSTGKACVLEGFAFVGVEKEAEYIKIAKARITKALEDSEKQQDAAERQCVLNFA